MKESDMTLLTTEAITHPPQEVTDSKYQGSNKLAKQELHPVLCGANDVAFTLWLLPLQAVLTAGPRICSHSVV